MARAPLLSSWIRAARPPLQLGVFVPLLYGQALAYAVHGTFSVRIAALMTLFGVLDAMLIAFSNDAVDFRTDSENQTFTKFSGGSRVVPMGLIAPSHLAVGALLVVLCLGATSAYLAFREGRAFMVVLAAIASHLAWIHGFSPFRLSYRGLGDFIAGVGFGFLLPIAGFYAQANEVSGLHPGILFPGFLLGFAESVTTSVPDAPSDAKHDKRTIAVRRGERAARNTSVALLVIAALSTPLAVPGATVPVVVVVVLVAATLLRKSFSLLKTADSSNRTDCAAFVTNNLVTALALFALWAASAIVVSGRV